MAHDIEVAGGAPAVAAAARAAAPSATAMRVDDVVLHAFATRVIDGYAPAAPLFAQALALELELATDNDSRSLSLSRFRNNNIVALELWDADAAHRLAEREVRTARETGALTHLQFALSFLLRSNILAGELTTAALQLDEADLIAEATGNQRFANAPMILAAWRGDDARASDLIEAGSEEAIARGWASNSYARAVLANGLGRHEVARDAVRELFRSDAIGYGTLLVTELVEAASRTGDRGLLEYAGDWLSERTRVLDSAWARGIEARARALTNGGEDADRLYRESIENLSDPRLRLELARAHLLYGEWLRRERRRLDAREQLRVALEAFAGIGANAFANRAERELLATGEHARKRTIETRDQLTPQEEQISRLVAQGQTNREIAAQLFISPNTVEYHLRKVFRKLGVKSRTQLAGRMT
jgi:DNA-binding CsgD family transcriptional regulator